MLAGITVVALEHAVAGPFATRQLADLGARVIKIERPGHGDFARGYDRDVRGLSSHFVWLNRTKESLTLDLSRPAAREIAHGLLARADVFVQNLAPGAAGRLGLGAEELGRRHPRLVCCSISGYGSSGPYRDKKAYDLLIQCETGLVSITGSPDAPAKAGIAVADIAAAMHAFAGILAALYDRERTGLARHVDVSLFDALGEWMGFPTYHTAYTGRELARTGARHAAIQPYGPFRAGDGRTVQLGIQNEREFGRFCAEVLGRPELAADPRFASNEGRLAHLAELTAAIEDAFSGLSAETVEARLDAVGIASANLNTVADFVAHPQLSARDRWREVDSPVGPVRALLPPATLSGSEAVFGPIPAVGEHSNAVLAELGYDEAAIAALRADGVV